MKVLDTSRLCGLLLGLATAMLLAIFGRYRAQLSFKQYKQLFPSSIQREKLQSIPVFLDTAAIINKPLLAENKEQSFVELNKSDSVATDLAFVRATAASLLHTLYKDLQHFSAPIVVGGIGDSGTRGIWSLLSDIGVHMGTSHQVKSLSKDSLFFMDNYTLYWANGSEYEVGAAKFYHKGLKVGGVSYTKESFDDDLSWFQGVSFTAKFVQRMLDSLKQHLREKNTPARSLLWGFKHPRTVLVLPFLKAVLGNYFKFVHVIRDAREVSVANNKRFYTSICRKYYYNQLHDQRRLQMHDAENVLTDDAEALCNETRRMRMKFWADINLDTEHFGRKFLGRERYIVVRIEDMVINDSQCLERVYRFAYKTTRLDLVQIAAQQEANIVLAKLAESYKSHAPSYFGQKFPTHTKEFLTKLVYTVPETRSAFEHYGYSLSEGYGLKYSCLELDHLSEHV